MGVMYSSCAFPVLALFMMQQRRFPALVGALFYVISVAALVVPDRTRFVRQLVNIIVFQLAILWASYLKERSERRMYTLREQLKRQFRATQRAQAAEMEASESKKRFVSYIFHEVRRLACLLRSLLTL